MYVTIAGRFPCYENYNSVHNYRSEALPNMGMSDSVTSVPLPSSLWRTLNTVVDDGFERYKVYGCVCGLL